MSSIKPDSAMSWVIMCVCAMNLAVGIGVGINCGVYVAAMIGYYGSSRAEGYIIGSVSVGLLYVPAPLVSFVIHKSSHRVTAILGGILSCLGLILSANVPNLYWQYCTFGVTALGCCFLVQSTTVCLVFYFDKYRPIANGLATALSGVGVYLYPILCLTLIKFYTWQPSFYIIAGICLNTCVGSALLRPVHGMEKTVKKTLVNASEQGDEVRHENETTSNISNGTKNKNPQKEDGTLELKDINSRLNENANNHGEYRLTHDLIEKETQVEVDIEMVMSFKSAGMKLSKRPKLRSNRSFLLYNLHTLLYGSTCLFPFVLAPDMYEKIKIPHYKQNILYIVLGISNIIGKIAIGALVNFKFGSVTRVYFVLNFLWGLGLLLFLPFNSYIGLIFANISFGLFFGGFICLKPLVQLDIVGRSLVNHAIGVNAVFIGLSAVAVTPLLGLIYDTTHSYTWLLVVVTTLAVIGTVVMAIPTFFWVHQQHGNTQCHKSTGTRE